MIGLSEAEYGMALGYADRLRADRQQAQGVVNAVAAQRDQAIRALNAERAAHAAALQEIQRLTSYCADLEAVIVARARERQAVN